MKKFRISPLSRLTTKYLCITWETCSPAFLEQMKSQAEMPKSCFSLNRLCAVAALYTEGHLYFYYRADTDWDNKRLQSWLRCQIRDYVYTVAGIVLPHRLHEFEQKYGLYSRGVSVKKLRGSTLGYCTAFNHIALSPRIMFFKERDMDSVILHEMAHLRYHHHRATFWNFLSLLLGEDSRIQKTRMDMENIKFYEYSLFFCR